MDGPVVRQRIDTRPQTIRFAVGGNPIETVDITDVETGVTFPERFFTP